LWRHAFLEMARSLEKPRDFGVRPAQSTARCCFPGP
jgi:hypothetical protein